MRYILTIVMIWFNLINCYSQGSWNIGYIEIDSISAKHLNVPIKLDFKHNWTKMNEAQKKHIRHYVTPEDTAHLLINSGKTVLIERRSIYVDHGSFKDQFLEIDNTNKKVSKRIYDTEILQLEENRIKVQVLITNYKIRNGEIKEELKSKTIELWLDKDKLDGIMIKKQTLYNKQ